MCERGENTVTKASHPHKQPQKHGSNEPIRRRHIPSFPPPSLPQDLPVSTNLSEVVQVQLGPVACLGSGSTAVRGI